MTLDPQAKWVLDIVLEANMPLLEEMSAEDAKATYERRTRPKTLYQRRSNR